MANLKSLVGALCTNLFYFALGFGFLSFVAVYTIFTVPIFIYRFIVTNFLAPCRGGNLRKAVNTNGNMHASDFLSSKHPPRCSVVVNLVLKGHVTEDQFCTLVDQNWVKFVNHKGDLQYPEFKQYLETWMGFLFWKQDTNFDLKNHTKFHKLPDGLSDNESEKYFCDLVEDLINRPYIPKQSPWEIHLIQNYKNAELLAEKGRESDTLSVFVFKIHHAMADGYAIMHLIAEQLLGHKLENAVVAQPTCLRVDKSITLKNVISKITYPLFVISEAGHLMTLIARKRTPFHIPDEKKSWLQIYGRVPLIPISKIRTIKNNLNVSFASVINAAIAGAVSRIWTDLDGTARNIPDKLLLGNAFPTAHHPKKLRNSVLGIAFNIAIGPNLSPLQRLKLCEKYNQEVKTSPMPMISGIGQKIFGGNLTHVTKQLLRNRYLAMGASIFPGPGIEHAWDNKPILAIDYTAGVLNGVAGIGFMALSYAGYVQMSISVENAVLSRQQLKQFIAYISEEFEALYALAMSPSNCTGGSDRIV